MIPSSASLLLLHTPYIFYLSHCPLFRGQKLLVEKFLSVWREQWDYNLFIELCPTHQHQQTLYPKNMFFRGFNRCHLH